MIQRIQSIYLLLFVLSCAALYALPLCTSTEGSNMQIFSITNIQVFQDNALTQTTPVPLYSIYNAALIVLGLVCIFMFRNRKLQLRLCSLLILATVIFIFLVFRQSDGLIANVKPIYHAGMYLLVVSLLWIFLAMRSIRHDENLVRSADRLR